MIVHIMSKASEEHVIKRNAKAFLEVCGYSEKKISQLHGNSELLRDLRLHGDNAWDELETLSKRFSVDLSSFPFDKYFPPEFERQGPRWLGLTQPPFWILFWRSNWAQRKISEYKPITLDMIDDAIVAKRWIFD